MSVEQGLERKNFQLFLEQNFAQANATEEWYQVRLKAWDQFQTLGLPSKKDEMYRYIKLRHLFSQPFTIALKSKLAFEQIATYIQPECQESVLVFVNGNFCAQLSKTSAISAQISISSLQEAMQTYGTFLVNQSTKSLKEEKDAFAAVNGALHEKGAFLYVPPKTVCSNPIQILNILHHDNQLCMANPRLHVFVGAHSEIQFLFTQKNLATDAYFVNQVIEMTLEENSKVHYAQVSYDEHPSSWHLIAFRAILKKHAFLKAVSVTEGCMTMRADYKVILTGENAEVLLNGLCMLKDKKESHTNIWIEHQAPHCRSYQLFKSVLNDFSRTSFEGKIMVRQAAQKTEAFQLNNNLILSDHAHADSKPNLEIFADDVKASHGATIGQLDQEQLFYMKTRGFNQATAMNLLVFGFCEQIIDLLLVDSIKQIISTKAKKYLMD